MHEVIVSRKYKIPAEKVWQAIDDFGNISFFHPLVSSSKIINHKNTGDGAERVCNFYDGSSIKERIIDYTPNKNYSVEIFDTGSFPLKMAVAKLEVLTKKSDESEVSFKMQYIPKFGALGLLMSNFMMKSKFKSIQNEILKGLEDHLSTGKIVGKKGVLQETA